MPRDKYVHLSGGRELKVYKAADGSEYYNDQKEKKTLRSNQKTFFKDDPKAEATKPPVNAATRRVSALPRPPVEEFVHLSDGRKLKLFTREDSTKYYIDGGQKSLRSNQRVVRKSSSKEPRKEPPVLKQASKPGLSFRSCFTGAKVQPTSAVGRVPPKAPKRCPYSADGKHKVSTKTGVDGRFSRSTTAKNAFLESKGLVIQPGGTDIDHVIPLWDGGADCPCNMQILSREKHKEKTAKEATERAKRAR